MKSERSVSKTMVQQPPCFEGIFNVSRVGRRVNVCKRAADFARVFLLRKMGEGSNRQESKRRAHAGSLAKGTKKRSWTGARIFKSCREFLPRTMGRAQEGTGQEGHKRNVSETDA